MAGKVANPDESFDKLNDSRLIEQSVDADIKPLLSSSRKLSLDDKQAPKNAVFYPSGSFKKQSKLSF